MSTTDTLPPETPAEAKSGGGVVLQRLVRRCVFGLLARGDSLNGWAFKMHSKSLFERREDAEAYIPIFSAVCCDPQRFECAVKDTLKFTIIEHDLYSPNVVREPSRTHDTQQPKT